MSRLTSEVWTTARHQLTRTSQVARKGLEWCAGAAHGVARLPRRVLHR